ncbi:MAG TPA: hypothetical protein VFG69_21015 [Nannocystaceae bacterium]|nr:hypothetical protein [Nannocystaceae bacterium]
MGIEGAALLRADLADGVRDHADGAHDLADGGAFEARQLADAGRGLAVARQRRRDRLAGGALQCALDVVEQRRERGGELGFVAIRRELLHLDDRASQDALLLVLDEIVEAHACGLHHHGRIGADPAVRALPRGCDARFGDDDLAC